jgi:histone-lysine N-methyltransferase EZH2
VEVIQLETARRLHFEHGLSFADIDQLGFLGTLRFSCQSGLLWDTFQRFVPLTLTVYRICCFPYDDIISTSRDVLRWPGVLSQLPEFVTTFEGDQRSENITHAALKTDLQARVNSLLKSFCPNLNCVQAACPTHCELIQNQRVCTC